MNVAHTGFHTGIFPWEGEMYMHAKDPCACRYTH